MTTLTEPVYPGEGGELLGAFVFKSKLFCFKDGGFAYSLNDSDTDAGNWYWQRISSSSGIAAPNAVTEIVDDMIVGNTYGTLTRYGATLALGNVIASDVIQSANFAKFVREQCSKSGILVEHLLYYAEKKLLFMTTRTGYRTTNDTLLVLDFGQGDRNQMMAYGSLGNIRGAIWQKGTPQCLAKYKDINHVDRPMYGDSAGFLNLMDQQDRLEAGAAYTGSFQTQHLDFGFVDPSLSATEKHFDFLAVHYVPASIGNLSCDYFIDGRYIDTLSFPMIQNTRAELGVLTLNTDRLAQQNEEIARLPIKGTGRTFSAYFYQSGSNQSFQVPAITVYFRGGGDGAQQV